MTNIDRYRKCRPISILSTHIDNIDRCRSFRIDQSRPMLVDIDIDSSAETKLVQPWVNLHRPTVRNAALHPTTNSDSPMAASRLLKR